VARAKSTADLRPVFAALRDVLKPFESKLAVERDAPTYYALVGARAGPQGKPTWFAGVRLGKQYVSYYLMPVYGNAALLADAPEALTKRMQGKACFNFKAVDAELFRALARLTKAGYKCFKKVGYV
jgi:hypothetical protein